MVIHKNRDDSCEISLGRLKNIIGWLHLDDMVFFAVRRLTERLLRVGGKASEGESGTK